MTKQYELSNDEKKKLDEELEIWKNSTVEQRLACTQFYLDLYSASKRYQTKSGLPETEREKLEKILINDAKEIIEKFHSQSL